jgi:hypothetical protein
MAVFFKDFPVINYKMGTTNVQMVNVMRRFKPLKEILNKAVIYYTYTVKDGERPDMVSYNIYNDVIYDWVLLMFNEKFDPYFSWPLDNTQFNEFMETKYGSLSEATHTVHHYEWILNPKIRNPDGSIIQERTLVVDCDTYLGIPDDERRTVFCFDWEFQKNENNRHIKVLDAIYLPQLMNEKAKIFGS